MKIVISPSGNLYGSENVLYDYLISSKIVFDRIYAPQNSQFYHKLQGQGFNCQGFKHVKVLFLKLILLLMVRKYNYVYINEGGHSRYLKILSYLFPKINFVIHIRIFEDATSERLSGLDRKNIEIISISQSICERIPISNNLIFDGFHAVNNLNFRINNIKCLKVGIVGRLTKTKGFDNFLHFYSQVNQNVDVEYHFYGDIDPQTKNTIGFQHIEKNANLFFHGFERDKNRIYHSLDILVHFNKHEPLGRIFFESLDYGVPFIGIDSAGIGEIARIINYPYVFSEEDFFTELSHYLMLEKKFDEEALIGSREKAWNFFSIENYTVKLDKFFK